MNRLLGIEGGQPLCTDDLVYMQQCATEAIKGVVSCVGLGKTNTILSGCEIVKEYNIIRWNEGYIALDGEVYPVKSGSYELPSEYDELYWVVRKEKYEMREFENGSQHYVYERGEAVISANPESEEARGLVSEMQCLGDDIMSFAQKYQEQNLNAEMAGDIQGGINVSCVKYSNGSAIQFLKVSVLFGSMTQLKDGYLFTYDALIPEVTSLVFIETTMYILRLNGGNAFMYNADGTPVKLLDDVGFTINLIV